MEKYRIKEKKFDDGRSEFFPEVYYAELKYVMDRPAFWYNFTEQSYNSYDEALIQITTRKENKKPFGKNVVGEKIHDVD